MPSDRFLRTMNRAHRTIRALTLGRSGWYAAGMPVVELTTTGRISGRPRTVLLTSPVHDDDRAPLPLELAPQGGDASPQPLQAARLRGRRDVPDPGGGPGQDLSVDVVGVQDDQVNALGRTGGCGGCGEGQEGQEAEELGHGTRILRPASLP